MPVYVDPLLPLHPLTVDDVAAMLDAGILGEDDRVELLDGVLVEMNAPGPEHSWAVRRLNMLLVPLAAEAGYEVSPQNPLNVISPISQPQPDIAIVPPGPRDSHAAQALLAIEISKSSRRLDLGRKAEIYAEAGIPEYWVLDVERAELVVHREPVDGRYTSVLTLTAGETVTAIALDLTVPVSELL